MMIICKDCRCFHPVTVSDRYCGECVIGDTSNAIAINAEITGCCLFEPKQPNKPKPLTNGDRIRQMTDEELAHFMVIQAIMGAISVNGIQDKAVADKIAKEIIMEHKADEDISHVLKWIKQEVSEDADD